MSLGAWVLTGLTAAGAVLALVSVVPVIAQLQRLRKRLQAIQSSRFVLSLMSMQLQANRLTQTAERARSVAERGSAAIATIEGSLEESGARPAETALKEAGAQLSALIGDLR